MWENSPQKPLLATRKWFFGHCYVQNAYFLKTLLIPDFEILWGEWTHIELKSWLDRPSGTFILHGGPLRPVVRLVGRSSVEQLQDPGTSQLLLPGERERDPSLQRREEVKLAFIICLIDRKQASYAVSCSMADT